MPMANLNTRSFSWIIPVLAILSACSPAAIPAAEPAQAVANDAATATLRIAVAQPLTTVGDVLKNYDAMKPLVKAAAEGGARLICFSESSLTGYDLKGKAIRAAISAEDPVLDEIAVLAEKHDVAILVGFYERDGNQIYNSSMVLAPDGHRTVQRKHSVTTQESSCEVVSGGRERVTFEIDGFRGTIIICADHGIEGIYKDAKSAGCDFTVLITAGAGSTKSGWHQADLNDSEKRERYFDVALGILSREIIRQSLDLGLAQVACNQSGWNAATEYFQPGGSSIIDQNGSATAVIPPRFVFEHLRTDLAIGEISKSTAARSTAN